MKLILSIFFITILFITTIHFQSIVQGCVAVRSTGNINMLHPDENEKGAWQLCTTSPSFRSFRHFSGTEENKQPLIKGAEVINLQTLYATKNFKENIKAGLEIKLPTDDDNLRNCCYDKRLNDPKDIHSFDNFI